MREWARPLGIAEGYRDAALVRYTQSTRQRGERNGAHSTCELAQCTRAAARRERRREREQREVQVISPPLWRLLGLSRNPIPSLKRPLQAVRGAQLRCPPALVALASRL